MVGLVVIHCLGWLAMRKSICRSVLGNLLGGVGIYRRYSTSATLFMWVCFSLPYHRQLWLMCYLAGLINYTPGRCHKEYSSRIHIWRHLTHRLIHVWSRRRTRLLHNYKHMQSNHLFCLCMLSATYRMIQSSSGPVKNRYVSVFCPLISVYIALWF